MSQTARKTALFPVHEALGARLVEFGGWVLPVQYQGVLAEHAACRQGVVAFDTGHMGQLRIAGPGAAEALARLGTQDATALAPGRCRYGFLLDEGGGTIDDTILMRLGHEEFLLVVNAGTREDDLEWVRAHLPRGLICEDLLDDGWGKIDVQGPRAIEALAPHINAPLGRMGYFHVAQGRLGEVPAIVSRTGYTGELGYEVMASGEALRGLFEELTASGGVVAAGLGARDSLRLEMGYPLYGHELSLRRNPVEASMEIFLKSEKDYIGSAVVRRALDEGVAEKLVAFRAESRRRPNPGNAVMAGDEQVGEVTSGAFCPSLGASSGMGYVAAQWAAPGRVLEIDTGRVRLPVTVVERPIYRAGTCRRAIQQDGDD